MSPDSAPKPQRRSPTATPDGPAARRFAFVLLLYALATVATFALVSRSMLRIAALYDYDIQSAPLQWGLYFGIFLLGPLLGMLVARRLPWPRSREQQLRLIFVGGVTLALVVGLYQGRFGPDKLWAYSLVGILGTFAAALVATWREWGLVEVVAQPRAELVASVRARHVDVQPSTTGWDHAKRAIDLVVSLAIVIISLPISVPLAMLVWLQDPGPLLVAKMAVQRGGGSFPQLKLRSMIKNAEGATGPVPAAPSDKRVTRLGGLLRRTHIDELPQMLNIALGQMSLVGPRPERTVFVDRHLSNIPRYALRHAVRPGLAGLAQVYGDYYSTPKEKLRYDLLYIRRGGPGLDAHLFLAALSLAFLGMPPKRRRVRGQRDERAYQRAYKALRGEGPADEDGER
jgi:lipopolysaccharide/colanic/teichoic acid biosynthesis glycosyltransferase